MTDETRAGREPVQIVEMQFPRCRHRYGCAPCQAGLGTIDTSVLTHNFAKDGVTGWNALNGTLTRVAGGAQLVATGANAFMRLATPTSAFDGDDFRFVVVHGTYNGGGKDEWILSFSRTSDATNYELNPLNLNVPFRGPALTDLAAGDDFVAVYDAATSANYATDWQGQTLDRFYFRSTSDADMDVTVRSITVCTENLFAARGGECFNTRSTCQDFQRFSSNPLSHIQPDDSWTQGEEFSSSGLTRDESAVILARKVSFPPSGAEGVIADIGASLSAAVMCVTGDKLVFRCGDVSAASVTDGCNVRVDLSEVAGRTVTLIGEIDDANYTARLWEYCEKGCRLVLLGEDTASGGQWRGGSAFWAGASDSGCGVAGGTYPSSESSADFNGKIGSLEFYGEQLYQDDTATKYIKKAYFGRKEAARPTEDIFIHPMLGKLSTQGSKINIAASDDNFDPLGSRATLEFSMEDAPATDRDVDPYYSDRPYDVSNGSRGLFWERLRTREKFGKLGARVLVYDGYATDRLSDMKQREYLLDQLDLPSRQNVRFRCRDILSRSELSKAQVPAASNGVLTADITDSATSFTTEGHTADEYPASGTVRINNECIQYSAIADNGDGTFTFTVTGARGSDGTTAAEHGEGDTVQICRRYTDAQVDDIMRELLGDDAKIQYQFLNLSGWASEVEDFLSAYRLTTLITEPTAVNQLVGEISEQCSLYVWWDERSQFVDMKAIRPLTSAPPRLTDSENLIEDSISFRELPRQRVSRVQVYYNQADPTQALDDVQNYINIYIDANLLAESDDQYGQPIIRDIFSRWLTTNALATQTASRLANRYEDVPLEATFMMDAKDRDYWVGDLIFIDSFRIRTAEGEVDTNRYYLITSAEEVVPGERLKYTAIDATLAGFVAFITPNSQSDRTGDPAIDGQYGFITDNNGFAGDGSPGSKIS